MQWGENARPIAFAAVAVAAALGCLAFTLSPSPARADGPGVGSPWAVSVGDSYISGEAGRWAGNTNKADYSTIDALGPKAYDDNPAETEELIRGCHRSKSAEIHIGGMEGENLACSGAKTTSFTAPEGDFKPGLDFYESKPEKGQAVKEGQALMLMKFASTHNVKLVAISIGGNNYNFASIILSCVVDFFREKDCIKDPSVVANFTPANIEKQTAAIQKAIVNVYNAMARAGYSTSQYTISVQDYPSPIPDGEGFRYKENERLFPGMCGFSDKDANWANTTALPTINKSVFDAAEKTGLPNIEQLDLSSAFNGRRLCEKGVGLLEEEGIPSWRSPEAVNKTEWINQIHILTFRTPFEVQEDLHPNYWGQLALRNCLTQVYNAGSPRSGACTISGKGLNAEGLPNMALKPARRLVIHRRHARPHRKKHRRSQRRRGHAHVRR
jgi:hypothetical protein